MQHLRIPVILTAAVAAVGLTVGSAPTASASTEDHGRGAVFVQTDGLAHNSVIAYDRTADGHLRQTATYTTGGMGAVESGAVVDPLASQGSLTLDRAHGLLFAVNGGSDTVTVFGVDGARLVRRQVLSSDGDLPVSVSVVGDLVYVLNARDGGSITGYRIEGREVQPIPGSTRALNLVPNGKPEFLQTPSQVVVAPDGRAVVVATKTHATLMVFTLTDGRPATLPVVTPSGTVPFALSFDRSGKLLVVDATGYATSYTVRHDGRLALVSTAGPTGQAAACWTVLVGGTLYAANAGSSSITALTDHHGRLSIAAAVAATTGAGPIDVAASPDGRFVYQLTGGSGQVNEFARGADGSLTMLATVGTGLGAASGKPVEGIAAS